MARKTFLEPQRTFRFQDVDEAPQRILPPIKDYVNTPLVSLNQAIAPLESIVPNVKHMVLEIQAKRRKPEDDLTSDESNSIGLYSMECESKENSLFYILNRTLRSDNRRELQPWFPFLRLILTALSRLPPTSLTVYRGVNMHLTDKYPIGTTIVWWAFSSCMKKNNQLEKGLFRHKTGKRTLFVISCYSGREIHRHSMFGGEDEVLLPPARQFKVVNTIDRGKGLHVIELNEIQPAIDLFDLFSLSTDLPVTHATQNIHFQPISTVSLSKKSLPAALPNRRFEERIAYLKHRSQVDLRAMDLSYSDIDIITSEIIIKKQCLELNLQHNKIGCNDIALLAHALQTNKTLVTLDLEHNQIGDKGAEYLSKALQRNTTLNTLNLEHNQIGQEGARLLSAALQKNTTLTVLKLSSNQTGEKGAEQLSLTLQENTTITVLTLAHNLIGDKGAQYFSESLQRNRTLIILDLASNQIGHRGAKYLSEALQTNTTLIKLYLGNNSIGEQGAEYLSESLLRNRTLTTLDLTSNQIGHRGVKHLSEALQINTCLSQTLSTLNLGLNQIGNEGAERLLTVLKTNKTLTTLDLSSNQIEESGACSLGAALKTNTTLTTLVLSSNRIPDDGACYLSAVLKTNKTLTKLHLQRNLIRYDIEAKLSQQDDRIQW